LATVSLSGNDTLSINNTVLNDLATGDFATLEYPNELMAVKTGKNGNSLFAFNTTGLQCEVKIRVVRGSTDDVLLLGLLQQMIANPPGFPLLQGEFVKQVGDGKGNITSDTYVMAFGAFHKQVPAKSNAEGDTEQAISEYNIRFANAPRALT
jgi:hypothetical protein